MEAVALSHSGDSSLGFSISVYVCPSLRNCTCSTGSRLVKLRLMQTWSRFSPREGEGRLCGGVILACRIFPWISLWEEPQIPLLHTRGKKEGRSDLIARCQAASHEVDVKLLTEARWEIMLISAFLTVHRRGLVSLFTTSSRVSRLFSLYILNLFHESPRFPVTGLWVAFGDTGAGEGLAFPPNMEGTSVSHRPQTDSGDEIR